MSCPDCNLLISRKGMLIAAGPVKCEKCGIETCYFCSTTHPQKTCKKLPWNSGAFPVVKSDVLSENCCRCRYSRTRGTETVEKPEKCDYCKNDICAYCIKNLTEMKHHICAIETKDEMAKAVYN